MPLTRETLQLRKGTQNEHAVFTGLPGEMTIDTTRDIPVIHDGVKLGGYPIIPIDILPNGNDFNIVTPHLLTPVQGDAGFVGVVEISPYTNQLVFEGVHESTDWQIATDGMFVNVIRESLKDTINLTTNIFYGLSADAPVFIRVRYISGEHLSGWSQTVQVTPMLRSITTPTVQVEGGPNYVPESPTLTSSPFVTFNSNETHASSTWVVTDSSGLVVWESVDSPDLTSIKIPLGVLTANTTYVFSVVYKSLTLTSLPGTVQATTVPVFPSIDTPTVQVEGGPSSVPLAPVITGSPFTSQGVQAGHTSTDWQVLDAAGTVVWESLNDTANLESVTVSDGFLSMATVYTFTALYHAYLLSSGIGSVQGATITPLIQTPTLQVEGSPTSVPENPTLTGSAFVITGLNEPHVSTDWSVKDANGVVVWSSLADTSNLTTIQIPKGILTPNTGYVFSVTYHSGSLTSDPGTLGARTVLDYPNILTPTVQIEGGPSSVPMAPVISTSAFAIVGSTETHVSTDWVVKNSSGVQTWTVQGDTTNLTSIKMPSGIVQVGGTYTFEARFNTQTLTSLYGSVQAGTIPAYLNDPTITVEGGPSLVPENPTLTSSVLSAIGNAGAHVSSDWQVKNSSGQVIWSSLGNVSSLTSIQIPRGVLAVNTSYTFEVRQHTSTLTTGWGSVTAVTKSKFAFIETPTIQVEGSATQLPENPILTSSAYVITGAVESHVSTDWIVTDSSGVNVWSSVNDRTNLTTITMPKGILQVNTIYIFTVKYNSATLTSGLGTATWITPAFFKYIFKDQWSPLYGTHTPAARIWGTGCNQVWSNTDQVLTINEQVVTATNRNYYTGAVRNIYYTSAADGARLYDAYSAALAQGNSRVYGTDTIIRTYDYKINGNSTSLPFNTGMCDVTPLPTTNDYFITNTTNAYKYNISTGSFSALASVPLTATGGTSISLTDSVQLKTLPDGKIIAIAVVANSGSTTNGNLYYTIYDPVLDTWSATNNYVYTTKPYAANIITLKDGRLFFPTMLGIYDYKNNTFTNIPSPLNAINSARTTPLTNAYIVGCTELHDGRIFATYSYYAGTTGSVIFDIQTNVWTATVGSSNYNGNGLIATLNSGQVMQYKGDIAIRVSSYAYGPISFTDNGYRIYT